MYGHVWTCMDMYGHVWTCMDMCGHVWTCVDMCGHVDHITLMWDQSPDWLNLDFESG